MSVTDWMAIAAFVISGWSAFTSWRTYRISLRPFLSVEFDSDAKVERNDDGSFKEVMFRIRNTGQGTAIVTHLWRHWTACPPRTDPEPMLFSYLDTSPKLKANHLPLGPGAASPMVPTRIPNLLPANTRSNGILWFQVRLEYLDLDGRRYAAQSAWVFNLDQPHMGIVFAWPVARADAFTFHSRIS